MERFVSGVLWWDDACGPAALGESAAEVARYRQVESAMPKVMAEVVRYRYGLERPKLDAVTTAHRLGLGFDEVQRLERAGVARLNEAFGISPPNARAGRGRRRALGAVRHPLDPE